MNRARSDRSFLFDVIFALLSLLVSSGCMTSFLFVERRRYVHQFIASKSERGIGKNREQTKRGEFENYRRVHLSLRCRRERLFEQESSPDDEWFSRCALVVPALSLGFCRSWTRLPKVLGPRLICRTRSKKIYRGARRVSRSIVVTFQRTSLTFPRSLAEVSRKVHFHFLASSWPTSRPTTRSSSRSLLFPTSIKGGGP